MKCDIGLIGLAVMGQNLVLNMNDHGYCVAVYNRTVSKVDEFLNTNAKGTNVKGTHSLEELVDSLKKPRIVMLMVKAGLPVDDFIEMLIPLLDEGDIVIDGGNSNFEDSIRRTKYLESHKMLFIGTGISGGEEGARYGPSIMPGGSPTAWPHVKEIFQSIAAKVEDGTPCCDWVGENGAGHFVKMVHNGIEYGMMSAYGEGFGILDASPYSKYLNFGAVAHLWNQGSVVRSWLLELAEQAFNKDHRLGQLDPYVEDSGEGRWTVQQAIETAVPAPVITAALFQRFRSRDSSAFSDRMLAALRNEFGGHAVKKRRTGKRS